LCALSVPILFAGLGSYSVVHCDEGFYHAVARHMARTGDLFHLDFVGEPRPYDTFMNAPLQYWARAALIALLGDGAWSMRLLSALCGLGAVLATHGLARRVAGPLAGLLAGLLLLTNFQFVYWHGARLGVLETAVCLLFALAARLFLRALEEGRGFAAHHACLLALLNVKTPLVVVALLAEGLFFAWHRPARARLRAWGLSLLAMLPLGLAWHVGQAAAHLDEAVEVARKMLAQASGVDPEVARRDLDPLRTLARYGSVAWFGAWPQVVLYAPALVWGLRERSGAPWRLLVCFPAAMALFHSLVAKQLPWYVIPAYPFLSVLTGGWLARLWCEAPARAPAVAVALALALLAWGRLPEPDLNPFDGTGWLAAWRRFPAALPAAGWLAPVAIATLAAGLAARRLGRPRLPGRALVVATLALATIRVALPLAHLGYVSPTDALHRRLDGERERGVALAGPIEAPEPVGCIAAFYFGEQYRVRRDGRRILIEPR
jgi:4-amino-4-deoxy-L-arabinose transferase-like glycosyltransferase